MEARSAGTGLWPSSPAAAAWRRISDPSKFPDPIAHPLPGDLRLSRAQRPDYSGRKGPPESNGGPACVHARIPVYTLSKADPIHACQVAVPGYLEHPAFLTQHAQEVDWQVVGGSQAALNDPLSFSPPNPLVPYWIPAPGHQGRSPTYQTCRGESAGTPAAAHSHSALREREERIKREGERGRLGTPHSYQGLGSLVLTARLPRSQGKGGGLTPRSWLRRALQEATRPLPAE